jgi:hypothetical protein
MSSANPAFLNAANFGQLHLNLALLDEVSSMLTIFDQEQNHSSAISLHFLVGDL